MASRPTRTGMKERGSVAELAGMMAARTVVKTSAAVNCFSRDIKRLVLCVKVAEPPVRPALILPSAHLAVDETLHKMELEEGGQKTDLTLGVRSLLCLPTSVFQVSTGSAPP